MKTILFVNDSYFSYLLAKPIIEKHSNDIGLIVFSTKIKGSKSNVMDVYRKTYSRYFIFRSFIEVLSKFNNINNKNTVLSLAKKNNIRTVCSNCIDEIIPHIYDNEIAISINFDQIYKNKVIKLFPKGIINLHASKLPLGRGISPALWAFARGDKEIWTTIYEIDSGLDSGRIFSQYSVPVNGDESYYSLYNRICLIGGENLLKTYDLVECGQIETSPQQDLQQNDYYSWPDYFHKTEMQNNNKRFIKMSDLFL
jgi:methionyl-tRNA formyltransferase